MLINLLDLINFSNNERLSQKYLKYYNFPILENMPGLEYYVIDFNYNLQ